MKKADVAEKVVTVESGFEALDFLTQMQKGVYPQPELIFLDINMPRMNGWEFMNAYNQLEVAQKGKIVVIMLTTSLMASDKNKARELEVPAYKIKPLTDEMLRELLEEHFPDYL